MTKTVLMGDSDRNVGFDLYELEVDYPFIEGVSGVSVQDCLLRLVGVS